MTSRVWNLRAALFGLALLASPPQASADVVGVRALHRGPCFPSYPSNHASGTNGGLEVLRRVYGAGDHSIAIVHPTLGMTLHYTGLQQIADDVDDARVYGGIHFRFDQEAGNRLGRAVGTYVCKNNLQRRSAQ